MTPPRRSACSTSTGTRCASRTTGGERSSSTSIRRPTRPDAPPSRATCATTCRSSGDLGVDVVGISPDEPEAQLAFDRKFSLGFPLLADTDHAVADAWGTWGEKTLYGKTYLGIIRSSFLVDADGKIVQAWYKVQPAKTVPKAKAALAAR